MALWIGTDLCLSPLADGLPHRGQAPRNALQFRSLCLLHPKRYVFPVPVSREATSERSKSALNQPALIDQPNGDRRPTRSHSYMPVPTSPNPVPSVVPVPRELQRARPTVRACPHQPPAPHQSPALQLARRCAVAPALCCSSGALPPELSRPYLPPEDRRNYKIFLATLLAHEGGPRSGKRLGQTRLSPVTRA